MPKITPFLWFDDQAEEAANLYVATFPNSRVVEVKRAGPEPDAKALTVVFELDGQRVIALNGGPYFQFSEAVSLSVDCADQGEIDRYWEALLADGGQPSRCGWLKDRFGFSWQIVPRDLPDLVGGPDPEGAKRAHAAMMTMVKLDLAELRRAYAGG
jgi:predicted 3-demethylubiquinone-9 3-methyltransferase (glyoxalase superfamily)